MAVPTKRELFFALNSKTSAIKSMNATQDLPKNCSVMLDPADPTCQSVIPWDGADECAAVGVVRCPRTSKAGSCVAVQIYDDFGIVKCAASGPGGEVDMKDSEIVCYCDETGTEYMKHVTFDHATVPPTITILNTDAQGNVYEPVGKEQKSAGKTTVVKPEFNILQGKETITTDDSTSVGFAPPATAQGAIIQITTSCCVRVCFDGSEPTPTSGIELGNGATLCVGCTPNSNGDIDEVANFKMIAEAGCVGFATATFYE